MPRAAFLVAALLAAASRALAQDLFACRVIVTGTDLRQHPQAVERCLRDVVVKATGRPSLRDDARIAAIAGQGADLIEDYLYLDRMTDIPHHDEQGTRDRPYDLIAHVRPLQLEQRLAAAGLSVWRDRPKLMIEVAVTPADGETIRLTADGDASERHRQALVAAAERFGMRVALPPAANGPVHLRGSLRWSPADFGWDADWSLLRDGAERGAWAVRGVSFDEAYRVGIGGAAERLAPP